MSSSISAGSTIRWERDPDGVVVLVLDDPGQAANTMNDAYLDSMDVAVARLLRERERIAGVVITSAKKTFFAGGDLNELVRMEEAEAAAILERLRRIRRQLRGLETLGRPVVAAIGGAALGGGLEIAMAAHRRVVVDSPAVALGFPEVTLGLLPGAGGVVRTVRKLGIEAALRRLLLRGQRIEPATGLELGIVDELVGSDGELVAAAKRWIASDPDPSQPWDRPGFELPGGGPATLAAAGVLPALDDELRREDPGSRYPAPRHIFDVAVDGADLEFDPASEIEARCFVDLATGPVSKNMIQAFFFDQQEVRGARAGDGSERPPRVTAARVARSGPEAATVAAFCAERGLTILSDGSAPAPETVEIAIDPAVANSAADGTPVVTGLIVSGLADSALAGSAEAYLRFEGPLERAPLLEIDADAGSSQAALNLALGLGKRLGLPAIFSAGARPMFSQRLLAGLREEEARLQDEGIPPAAIRRALLLAGFTAPARGETGGDAEAGSDLEEVELRLLFAPALVAAHALVEGSVGSAAQANVASIAVGFPGWTGGAIQFAAGHTGGLPGFFAVAQQLAGRHGSRFEPPAALCETLGRGG